MKEIRLPIFLFDVYLKLLVVKLSLLPQKHIFLNFNPPDMGVVTDSIDYHNCRPS